MMGVLIRSNKTCRVWTGQQAVGWCTCKDQMGRVPKQATTRQWMQISSAEKMPWRLPWCKRPRYFPPECPDGTLSGCGEEHHSTVERWPPEDDIRSVAALPLRPGHVTVLRHRSLCWQRLQQWLASSDQAFPRSSSSSPARRQEVPISRSLHLVLQLACNICMSVCGAWDHFQGDPAPHPPKDSARPAHGGANSGLLL
ncbi:hypothetical protein WJX77_011048 [Trebouxia sp. C0004]